MAAEAATADVQAAEAHRRALADRREQRAAAEADAARRRERWSLGQARALIRQGYSVAHVVERTGWDADWLT